MSQAEPPFLHSLLSWGRTLSSITDSSLREAQPGCTSSCFEHLGENPSAAEQRAPLSCSRDEEVTPLEKLLGLGAPCPCARGITLVNGLSALQTSTPGFLPVTELLGVQTGTEWGGREQGTSSWCGRSCSQAPGSGCWCSSPGEQISQLGPL